MKFKNIVSREDGELEFSVECTKDEVSYLVNHAVQDLLSTGIISLNKVQSEQEVTLRGAAH